MGKKQAGARTLMIWLKLKVKSGNKQPLPCFERLVPDGKSILKLSFEKLLQEHAKRLHNYRTKEAKAGSFKLSAR